MYKNLHRGSLLDGGVLIHIGGLCIFQQFRKGVVYYRKWRGSVILEEIEGRPIRGNAIIHIYHFFIRNI